MPIYKVTTQVNGAAQDRIIDAKTKAQAINYVTRSGVEAEVLTASQLLEFIQAGVKVETATEELAEPTPTEAVTVGEQ